jgi:hypothetical protein
MGKSQGGNMPGPPDFAGDRRINRNYLNGSGFMAI